MDADTQFDLGKPFRNQSQPGTHGQMGRVLVGLRIAEIGQQSSVVGPNDVTGKLPNDFRATLLGGAEQVQDFVGVVGPGR